MAVAVHGVDEVQDALDVRLVDAGRGIVDKTLRQAQRQERTMLSLGWHTCGERST